MNCVVRLGMPEVYVVGGELTWEEERCMATGMHIRDVHCSIERAREKERERVDSFFRLFVDKGNRIR